MLNIYEITNTAMKNTIVIIQFFQCELNIFGIF
jgi:hypothetical protein